MAWHDVTYVFLKYPLEGGGQLKLPNATQLKKEIAAVKEVLMTSILEFQFLHKGKCNVFKGTNRTRRKNALLTVADGVPYPKRRVVWAYQGKSESLKSEIIANCFNCLVIFPPRF